MSDLSDLHERCANVHELLDELLSKMKVYLDRAVVITEDRSNPPHLSIYGEILEPVPVRIRVDLGNIVNELRSILDALATVLAVRNSGDGREADFPILKSEQLYDQYAPKRLKRLSPKDRDAIRSLQPWEGGHRTLFRLHEADRHKKHQKLLGASAGAYVVPSGHGFMGEFYINGSTVEEVGVRRHLAGGTYVNTKIERVTNILYTEPPALAKTPAYGLAYQSALAVSEIVQSFEL